MESRDSGPNVQAFLFPSEFSVIVTKNPSRTPARLSGFFIRRGVENASGIWGLFRRELAGDKKRRVEAPISTLNSPEPLPREGLPPVSLTDLTRERLDSPLHRTPRHQECKLVAGSIIGKEATAAGTPPSPEISCLAALPLVSSCSVRAIHLSSFSLSVFELRRAG
jgi:hypothetical protein